MPFDHRGRDWILELVGLGERLESVMLRIRSIVAVSSATVFVGLVLALGGTASAHAELLSSNPAADAVLESSPPEVVLTFGEGVDMVPDSIRVVTSSGDTVDIGDLRRADGSATIAADLPPLADGSYVVAWRAVSADSHPISGAFTFSVGAATATQPGLVDELLAESQPSGGAERWLAVGRSLSYVGVTASIGVAALLMLMAPALVAARRTRTVLVVCLTIGAVGTVVMIAAQASIAVGDVWAWGEVAGSSAGRWWFIRLAGIAVATALVLTQAWGSTRRWWSMALATVALGLLVVVAAGGHGITGRHVTLGFVATVLHLAAMSTWFGGLVALTLTVPRGQIAACAGRFSPIALCSVVVLAATGVFNAWRQIGSWDALTDSDYGTWLIVKLIVLGAVLAVAVGSRWLLRQSHAEHGGAESTPTDRALARTVVAEVVGIVLVFAATAGLVNAAPPYVSVPPEVASTTVVEGDRLAQIILDPPVTGGTAMHVYLSSSTGSLDQPTDITVTATLSAQGIGPLTIPVVPAGPGHVSATDANLPIAGTWTFAVTARYSEFDQVTFTADLDVR